VPKVDYAATIDVPRPVVWDFVRDINNWAPFAKGYQEHELVNDRESLWIVKGDIGPISRVTKFHVTITEWAEGERVGFVLKGLNESVSGEGAIRLTDTDTGTGTRILGEAILEFGGSLGPVINQLFAPWARAGADELVTKIALALQPSYVRPKEPLFVLGWLRAAWRLVLRLVGAGRRPSAPEPAPAAVELATADLTAVPAEHAGEERRVPLRIETLLLTPSVAGGEGGGALDLQGIGREARRIEELGFDGATAPEAGHDPFLPLMIAAEHTKQITLGTNVAIAFPRSPMVTAQIAWDLQRYSGGRFKLGIGTQVKGHNERRYSTPWTGAPGPRLREYILCLKAIFQTFQEGARPSFQGKHYQFTLISPFFNPGPIEHSHVPLYIAALNTYMARLAGELCDGVLLHPLGSHDYTREVVLPAVRAGAEKAERHLDDIDIVAAPFIITGKDRSAVDAALAPVRQQIAFYSSTRTYHSVLEFHGWTEVGQQLHALSIEGKWREMMDLVTDEMLEQFATIGTYDEIVPKLKERWGGVCSTLFLALSPHVWQDETRLGELVEALRKL